MSDYNAFKRGIHPVGTRSFEWTDQARERTLPVDVWYPATSAYQGKDSDEASMDRYQLLPGTPEVTQLAVRDADSQTGRFPLIIFSHGFGGERRQSTFFYTHLASHGYVVAAMDHVGNTTADMLSGTGSAGDALVIEKFIEARPLDASFVIDQMLAGAANLDINADQIGMSGHSFGGWTTIKTLAVDARIKAALPLAPAGGVSKATNDSESPMSSSLTFNWGRDVPTLYLVAELDSILPLDGMQDLYAKHPEPSAMIVLQNADHFHFNDHVEETHDGFKLMMGMMATGEDEDAKQALDASLASMKASADLCPGEHAYTLINGLGLAHFDANLRGIAAADSLLHGDLESLMAGHGVNVRLMETN